MDIEKVIERLEKKKAIYQKNKNILKEDPEFIRNYEDRFLVKYTFDSTSIEGNSLTLDETRDLLMNHRTPAQKDVREIYEQINHRNAFRFMTGRVKGGYELNEEIVLRTHELLVQNIFQGGNYRNNMVYIQGSMHECPKPEELPLLMKRFYEELENKNSVCGMPESGINPIELACWTHCDFVSLHPFRDGNGRTSRLMMNYQLLKHGYVPVSIPVERKTEYYQALEHFHRTGDSGMFKELICGLEEKELDFFIQREQMLMQSIKREI